MIFCVEKLRGFGHLEIWILGVWKAATLIHWEVRRVRTLGGWDVETFGHWNMIVRGWENDIGPASRDAHVFLCRAHIMDEASTFTAPRTGLM